MKQSTLIIQVWFGSYKILAASLRYGVLSRGHTATNRMFFFHDKLVILYAQFW